MIIFNGTTSDLSQLEYHKDFLKNNGIETRIDTIDGENRVTLIIHEDILKQKIERGGRYRKLTNNGMTIAEVFELRKTKTDKDIYEQLGISKPTYYRRLKSAKNFIEDIGYDEAKNFHF